MQQLNTKSLKQGSFECFGIIKLTRSEVEPRSKGKHSIKKIKFHIEIILIVKSFYHLSSKHLALLYFTAALWDD